MATTGASTFTKIEAIINNRELYELGDLIPKREEGDVGRPRDFPDYTAFLFDALISVFGSANKVETELADRKRLAFRSPNGQESQ